jgi:hypothetical protein
MSKRSKTIQRDPQGRELSSYEEVEDDDVLKDGQSIRVPLMLMDGSPNPKLDATQRAVGKDAPTNKLLVDDGTNNTHKPGFRYSTDAGERIAADAALTEAYEAREHADREAWRSSDDHPLNTKGTSHPKQQPESEDEPRGQQAGDTCSVNGSDAQSVEDAYRLYDEQQQNAWRGDDPPPTRSRRMTT